MNQQGARGRARLGPWETFVPHPRPLVVDNQHKLYYDAHSNTSYSPPSSRPAVLKRLRSFSLRPEPFRSFRATAATIGSVAARSVLASLAAENFAIACGTQATYEHTWRHETISKEWR
jgi:hypothetical protein